MGIKQTLQETRKKLAQINYLKCRTGNLLVSIGLGLKNVGFGHGSVERLALILN